MIARVRKQKQQCPGLPLALRRQESESQKHFKERNREVSLVKTKKDMVGRLLKASRGVRLLPGRQPEARQLPSR